MSTTAYIGLGSNLGDRRQTLDLAVTQLRAHSRIVVSKVSNYEETEPIGGPAGQGLYLNGAVELETDLGPHELLSQLLEIEKRLGRVRDERNGPRTIDLDLLLYGVAQIQSPELELPHPRMAERLFVLRPLAAIAPLAVHPTRQSTVADLLRQLEGSTRIPVNDSRRELAGQRALVTGSTSGIGRAIALALATAGADILVHGFRSWQAADETADRCRSSGVRAGILMADLQSTEAIDILAAEAWDHWSGLDILVNNAGADTLTGEAAGWSFERKLEMLWTVDVAATMRLSRTLGQRMKERGHGVILNMGWDQAETGMKGDSGQLFAAAKGAVMAFSKSLALSLAPQVRVNCLAPGWIRTAWGAQASQAWQERVMHETPLGRWGTPEDVARTACWLISPAAEYITGQIMRVNGGAVR